MLQNTHRCYKGIWFISFDIFKIPLSDPLQMNEFSQKIIEFTAITQQVQDQSIVSHQTDSAVESFDNIGSPPRGDTSVPKIAPQNFPAFWHTFLPPEHVHTKNPSVTKP